jgi:hypothetical protein
MVVTAPEPAMPYVINKLKAIKKGRDRCFSRPKVFIS